MINSILRFVLILFAYSVILFTFADMFVDLFLFVCLVFVCVSVNCGLSVYLPIYLICLSISYVVSFHVCVYIQQYEHVLQRRGEIRRKRGVRWRNRVHAKKHAGTPIVFLIMRLCKERRWDVGKHARARIMAMMLIREVAGIMMGCDNSEGILKRGNDSEKDNESDDDNRIITNIIIMI